MKGSLSGWKDKKNKAKKMLWSLKFYRNDSLVLIDHLYYRSNLPCLYRKRKIAENYIKKIGKIN